MELYITKFFDTIFNEAGIVAVSFLFGLIYQTRQLNSARAECKNLNNQILQLATSMVSASKEVQRVLEKIVEAIPTGGKND